MTDLQPLILVYFKLPPNHQSLLQIRETLESVFVPQLESLSSALKAAHVIHPSTQATQILREARKVAVDEMDKLWDFFHLVGGIASRYIEFLVYLSQNNLEEERYAYRSACLLAQALTLDSGKAQQVMANFREGIGSAIGRIISIMAGNNEDMSPFIRDSSKVLAEIVGATDECRELLRECRKDFANLEKEDFDEESFMCNPSWEEHQVALQKWRVFAKIVRSLWAGWSRLENGIRGEERRFATSDNTPREGSRDTKKNDMTNNSLRYVRNPHISTDNSNNLTYSTASTLATPSLSNKAKVSSWQKIIRRIMPCLSLKPFG